MNEAKSEVKLGSQVSRSRLGSARYRAKHSIATVQIGKEPRKGPECKCSSQGMGDKKNPNEAGKTMSELTFSTIKQNPRHGERICVAQWYSQSSDTCLIWQKIFEDYASTIVKI